MDKTSKECGNIDIMININVVEVCNNYKDSQTINCYISDLDRYSIDASNNGLFKVDKSSSSSFPITSSSRKHKQTGNHVR